MSPLRTSVILLAIATMALRGYAQEIETAEQFSSPQLAAASVDAGAVEPIDLPGNVTLAPAEELAATPEPALPAPEPEAVMEPADDQPQELAATPRRFRYELSVDVRGVYDDNVTLSRGENRRADFYTAVMPRIALGIGDFVGREENFVAVDYSPSGYFYFDNSDFSTLEQIGRLEAQWQIRRVTLSLVHDFESVQSSNLNVARPGGGFANQTNLDVGGRRRINSYLTEITAKADLTGKTSIRASASYDISDPEDLIGSATLAGTIGADYRYGPKLSVGIAVAAGQQFVDEPSPDTTFQQVNVRGSYEVTGKISASGSAGVQFRQSEDGTRDRVSPIFRGGIAYAPFDGTQIDLSATRRTMNSASAAGQDFTSTQLVISARQRLLHRFYLSLATGIQNQTYFSTSNGVSTERDDNYYFIAPGIDVRITNFWFAGVFYTFRENDSSIPFYTFDDNQYGIRTTLTF